MTIPSRHPISIRTASRDDAGALRRLAELDSAPVPEAPVLVAEGDGELRAALSLRDGQVVADPFAPTARLVVLLEVHAAQLAAPSWGESRRRSALRAARAVWNGLADRKARPDDPYPARAVGDPALALAPYGLLRAP